MVLRIVNRLGALLGTPQLLRQVSRQQAASEEKLDRLFRKFHAASAENQQLLLQELRQLNRRLARQEHRSASAEALRASGIDLSHAFGAPEIGPHVERAIASAALVTDPMPHLVAANLLPQVTYDAVIGGLPPEVCFNERDKVKKNMRLEHAHGSPDWTIRMLTFLEQTLIPRMLAPALLRRFEPFIQDVYVERFGAEHAAALARLPHTASAGRLMLRRPGYHLDPHLDPKRVVVTTLLYFARPHDDEAFGTTFYRMQGTPVFEASNTLFPELQGVACTPVRSTPFRANTAVAFLNFGGAHGAGIPEDAPADTQRYAYQFYLSPDRSAAAAICGD